MTQTIYLDVYFCFNFLMDFSVLFLTKILIHNKNHIARITLAALFGSLYAVVVLVFNLTGIITMLSTYLGMAAIMQLIAFGKAKIKVLTKNTLIVYAITFFLNGAINMFYYGKHFGEGIIGRAVTSSFDNIDFIPILTLLIIIFTSANEIIKAIRNHMNNNQNIYKVKIISNGKNISVTALCDTGNSLKEPMTGRPVCVVEASQLTKLLDENLRYIMIPYNAVGTNHGMLKGFFADELIVDKRVVKNAVIAIYHGKLSVEGAYKMLLNPKILEGQGDVNDY